jgi:KaiC/GvpD/RAD55 family RecA-like ATPase
MREYRGGCPVHDGKDPNFSVNARTGFASCHSKCQSGWDVIGLERELTGADFIRAKASVYQIIGRPEPTWEERDIEATFDYTDAEGNLVYQVVRKLGKQFMQRRRNSAGTWIWGLAGATPVPYRLHEWKDAPFVAIVEGEKDVRSLETIGLAATCNNGGAGNFKAEIAKWFAGKKVAIFPDNDDPGREHALKVAELLSPVAKSVRVIEIPDLPAKGDVTDFINSGGTKKQLQELYTKSQEWSHEWQFSSQIPDENDRYVRSLNALIVEYGGLDGFWDMRQSPGLPTPWRGFTKAMGGGLRRGEVYVIGGNQGSGKSSLLLQFLIAALRARFGALLFSMEMGHRDVFHRMVSIEARVDLLHYRELQQAKSRTEIEEADLHGYVTRLAEFTHELGRYPLSVTTKTRVTPEYLLTESKRLKKREKIDLIAIDHMQLMGSTGSVRGDYEKMTAISRMTKEVASELQVPVLIVSQTSRANSTDKRTELEVSDLRGSGAIEEDAAGVMLIYPDKEDRERRLVDQSFPYKCKSWLKKGKDRFGMQNTYLPLMHTKTFTRFDLYQEGE